MPPPGIGILFNYETQKIVQINSTKVGIINRLIQIFIFSYIIGWVMIYNKGYQATDKLISSVSAKIKGIGIENVTNPETDGSERIWDSTDYVVPPQEYNSFFITTNAIITKHQTHGKCAEEEDNRDAICNEKKKCKPGFVSVIGFGKFTGKCLPQGKGKNGICEIISWCPTETDILPFGKDKPLFPMAVNYTILFKNDIEFPKFNVKRRNILSWSQKKFLYTCKYNSTHPEQKYCPIIRVGTILDMIKADKMLLIKGGIVGIFIDWKCNLDWNVKYCKPAFSFRRLDNSQSKIGKGFNFRYANYYYINGTQHRDLIKAYGIRFLIFVNGEARKFNIIPLTMNLGSGMALLALASVICDVIVLHVLGQKEIYQKAKFQEVHDE